MWPVVYYRDQRSREPVNDEIDRLAERDKVIVDNHIGRLKLFGPDLPYPWSSQVEGELRELRADSGPTHYRILYRRSANLFVLLYFLDKRTGTIPKADIEIANKRWDDFQTRMNAKPRRPPRAAGHDAP